MSNEIRFDSAAQGANAARGLKTEHMIEAINAWYLARGAAVIVKVPLLTFVTSRGTARVIGKGPVDFVGHQNGMPVAFDTKSTITDKFKLERSSLRRVGNGNTFRRSGGQTHQATFLLDWLRQGKDSWNGIPLGFFLVHQTTQDLLYVVSGELTLKRLEDGLAVTLYRLDEAGVAVPLWPIISPASTLDIATGRKPSFDYLEVLK